MLYCKHLAGLCLVRCDLHVTASQRIMCSLDVSKCLAHCGSCEFFEAQQSSKHRIPLYLNELENTRVMGLPEDIPLAAPGDRRSLNTRLAEVPDLVRKQGLKVREHALQKRKEHDEAVASLKDVGVANAMPNDWRQASKIITDATADGSSVEVVMPKKEPGKSPPNAPNKKPCGTCGKNAGTMPRIAMPGEPDPRALANNPQKLILPNNGSNSMNEGRGVNTQIPWPQRQQMQQQQQQQQLRGQRHPTQRSMLPGQMRPPFGNRPMDASILRGPDGDPLLY